MKVVEGMENGIERMSNLVTTHITVRTTAPVTNKIEEGVGLASLSGIALDHSPYLMKTKRASNQRDRSRGIKIDNR